MDKHILFYWETNHKLSALLFQVFDTPAESELLKDMRSKNAKLSTTLQAAIIMAENARTLLQNMFTKAIGDWVWDKDQICWTRFKPTQIGMKGETDGGSPYDFVQFNHATSTERHKESFIDRITKDKLPSGEYIICYYYDGSGKSPKMVTKYIEKDGNYIFTIE